MSLLLALMCLSGPAQAAPLFTFGQQQSQSMTAEERYEKGLRHMRTGYLTKALEEFQRVRNYHRDDPVSVLAELAIADVYYKKGEYEQARLAYEDFARLHPRHENLDYVVFRKGLSIYKRASVFAGRDQTSTRQAVNTWTGFDRRFPDSEHIAEVETLLGKSRDRLAQKELWVAKFYAKRHAWGAVQGRLEVMLRGYKDTEVVPEALSLLATAYHAWGQQAEAQQVRERLAQDFPASSWLAHTDRALAKPAGEPPKEESIIRPYRYPGMGMATGQGMM